MKILITGGTGFIGKALVKKLLQHEYQITVLSRNAETVRQLFSDSVTPLTDLHSLAASNTFNVIINLAGAPIFDRRWTRKQKKLSVIAELD